MFLLVVDHHSGFTCLSVFPLSCWFTSRAHHCEPSLCTWVPFSTVPGVLSRLVFLESAAVRSLPGPRRGWGLAVRDRLCPMPPKKRLHTSVLRSLSLWNFCGFWRFLGRCRGGVLVVGGLTLHNRHPPRRPHFLSCMIPLGIFSSKGRRSLIGMVMLHMATTMWLKSLRERLALASSSEGREGTSWGLTFYRLPRFTFSSIRLP